MAKPKVFIGYQDLCSTIGEMTMALKKSGYDVFSAVHDQNNMYDISEIDFNIEKETAEFFHSFQFKILYKLFKIDAVSFIKKRLLKKIIKECDIFILYHPPLFLDASDMAQIKKAGKKIVCLVFGDDVRWYNGMKQQFATKGKPPVEYEEEYIRSLTVDKWVGYLRHAERYADMVVMHPDTAHMALRPYKHYYMQLDGRKFAGSMPQRKIPVVAHAPSFKKGKGTSYILEAVNELKQEGLDFEFRLMEKIPYDQVYDFYKDIDIMVVQMFGHGGGKQSYELLSCGKVVISRMQYDEYLPHIKEECPIIDADIYSVKDVLRETILNYDKRVELSGKGHAYVMKYHDVHAFCKRIMDVLNNPGTPGDYIPTFFREEYMPLESEVEDLNKWNQFVEGCDWYKKQVKPGERAGLRF